MMKNAFYLNHLKRSFRSPHIFGLFFDNIFLWLYFYNSQNFTVRLHLALEKRTNLYILIVDVPFNDIINLEIYLSCRIKPFFRRKERNIHNLVPRASFRRIRGKLFFKNALGTRLKHSNISRTKRTQ